jgi:hypothetical protein
VNDAQLDTRDEFAMRSLLRKAEELPAYFRGLLRKAQPDTKGRFVVMQALNMWTDDFASSGSRTTGTEAGSFLIAGPKWRGTAAPDVKATFRSTTRYAWVRPQLPAEGGADGRTHGERPRRRGGSYKFPPVTRATRG